MEVLHINYHARTGGAARAAYRLHLGLRGLGHNSHLFVAHLTMLEDAVTQFRPANDLRSRFQRIAAGARTRRIGRRGALASRQESVGWDLFSDDRSPFGADLLGQMPIGDVINLHWIAGFVDYRAFFSGLAGDNIAVVWTLHDMNPFTGGCHYAGECSRFVNSCGNCPQLGSFRSNDLSRRIWQRKKVALCKLDNRRLYIVSPSRWLATAAKQSSLLKERPVTVIPYGLDTQMFHPVDQAVARAALQLPEQAKVVLFAAHSIANQRKGLVSLKEALGDGRLVDGLHLLVVGHGGLQLDHQVPCRSIGFIEDDGLMALVYSAADVYVIPSLQDNLPNTVLESMACGTPVIGFDTGGIPDMVRPGATGLLAPTGDVAALREAIRDLLNNPAKREEMSVTCRQVAVEEYSAERQAQRYVELYESILADR